MLHFLLFTYNLWAIFGSLYCMHDMVKLILNLFAFDLCCRCIKLSSLKASDTAQYEVRKDATEMQLNNPFQAVRLPFGERDANREPPIDFLARESHSDMWCYFILLCDIWCIGSIFYYTLRKSIGGSNLPLPTYLFDRLTVKSESANHAQYSCKSTIVQSFYRML